MYSNRHVHLTDCCKTDVCNSESGSIAYNEKRKGNNEDEDFLLVWNEKQMKQIKDSEIILK